MGALLLGTTRVELEGEVRTIRPLIYTALNTNRGGLRELDDAYIRRSVVIDTTPLRELLVDADLAMARLFDGCGRIPRLSLERLKPPLAALPPDLWRLPRDELRHDLTEDGWALSDTESLARVALGRAAYTHGDLEQDVLAVALDALCCASTRGHTIRGYVDRLAHRLGAGVMVPDPEAVERERQRLVTCRLSRDLERAMERDQLVEDRGRLERMLDEAIDRLDLRRLKGCSRQQRVEGTGSPSDCVRSAVTPPRHALETPSRRRRPAPATPSGAPESCTCRSSESRALAARSAPLRTRPADRNPELQPARTMVNLIAASLPGAHGTALDTLDGQAHQLEAAPPPAKRNAGAASRGSPRKRSATPGCSRLVGPHEFRRPAPAGGATLLTGLAWP
jgi:hypothetical protein